MTHFGSFCAGAVFAAAVIAGLGFGVGIFG